MKLWIDGKLPPPDASWHWAKDSMQALIFLAWNRVREISFSYDLGDSDTALPVASRIAQLAREGRPAPVWHIHAGGEPARKRLENVLRAA